MAPRVASVGGRGDKRGKQRILKMCNRGGPGELQRGGDGATVSGQSPATDQRGEGQPRPGGKDTLKHGHHKGAK
jgi:hypothetical protein